MIYVHPENGPDRADLYILEARSKDPDVQELIAIVRGMQDSYESAAEQRADIEDVLEEVQILIEALEEFSTEHDDALLGLAGKKALEFFSDEHEHELPEEVRKLLDREIVRRAKDPKDDPKTTLENQIELLKKRVRKPLQRILDGERRIPWRVPASEGPTPGEVKPPVPCTYCGKLPGTVKRTRKAKQKPEQGQPTDQWYP